MSIKVFVYGTLMGDRTYTHRLNNHMMFSVKGQKFNFPVIQAWPYEEEGPTVFGAVLEVDEEDLPHLDKYEGVASGLYVRKQVDVETLERDSKETVWVYVGGPAIVNEPIPSGMWNT